MRLQETVRRLLSMAETIHRWVGQLATLETERRARVARYADDIAATLARAAEALAGLEADPSDRIAARAAIRELGRVSGYVETIAGVLDGHFDGRKLAGLRRRLQRLDLEDIGPSVFNAGGGATRWIERLLAAEGYFRALADGLRT